MSSFSSSCFWALLSPEQFRFLYLPRSASKAVVDAGKSVADLLMHRSLLDFVHPDELSYAQTDFARFLNARTPAGSITRCRLRSFGGLAHRYHVSSQTADDPSRFPAPSYSTAAYISASEWTVVDVVMYIATETFVLAFFHDPGYFRGSGVMRTQCGQFTLEPDEVSGLLDLFDRWRMSSASADGVTKLFQIHVGHRLQVSWPRCHDNGEIDKTVNDIMRKEIPFCIDNKCSEGISGCTHHHYSSSIEMLTTGMVRIERIIIPYGQVVFVAVQLTPIAPRPQQQMTFYKHYVHCNASLIKKPQESFVYACSSTTDFGNHTGTAIAATSNSMSIDKLLLNSATISSTATTTTTTTTTTTAPSPRTTTSIMISNEQAALLVASKSAATTVTAISLEPRVCAKCRTHSSPEWRKGPSGSKTLCNACGLRFSRSIAKQKRIHQTQRDFSQ